MASGELKSTNGTVDWDGVGMLRVRYDGSDAGLSKLTSSLRTRLGQRTVPVEALKAIEVDRSPDVPVLRLVLREDADPLQSVTGGYFDALIDPYSFPFAVDDLALAEGLATDIRVTLTRRDVPTTAAVRWLVAPPVAPDEIEGRDATVSVASGRLVFAYKRTAGRKKRADGNPWSVPLADIIDVEWMPNQRRLGSEGFLRISTARTPLERPKPRHDPAAMVTERGTDVDALFFAARLLTRIRP
ncbi:MAG TPA: DUF4429 domain-containing protein [Kribbella sp.]|nr:DUF4429 domain-containing protein [Kribbella sp.]